MFAGIAIESSMEVDMGEKICSFHATLPDIQSAINFSGSGNGARIKLDVAENKNFSASTLNIDS